MYFNPQGVEKLNDTSRKMYFDQHGLEMLYINQNVFQPTGLEKLNVTSTKMFFNQQVWRS